MVEESKVELGNYINLILKRKKLIITGTLICMTAIFIMTLRMPKTYRTEAVFQNAVVAGKAVIKNVEVPEVILGDEILGKALSKFSEISPQGLRDNIEIKNIKDTTLFKIVVKSNNPELTQDICGGIIGQYFKYARPLLEEKINRLKSQISVTDKRIFETENLMKRLEGQINAITTEKKDMASELAFKMQLLINRYVGQQKVLYGFYSKKNNLENQLLNITKFKIISSPFKPGSPVSPKIKQNILLSGILGLMFFTFLAFFVECLKNKSRD